MSIDWIEEIVGADGVLAKKGYREFVERHGTLQALTSLLAASRDAGDLIVHVRLGFKDDYADHPAGSPLLGGARSNRLLVVDTASTAIIPEAAPLEGEPCLRKTRVSAFYRTGLEDLLRKSAVDSLVITGVATDLAVQSAVLDAHDRDFKVAVAATACAAANEADHASALTSIAKLATIL